MALYSLARTYILHRISDQLVRVWVHRMLTVTHRYQYAHPSAKARESSIKRSAYSVNDPVTGIKVAISPSDCLWKLASFHEIP